MNENIKDLLLTDIDFSIKYVSLHYPFKATQILEFWQLLDQGSAFYSVYIADAITVCNPDIGLCFNKNIEWTDALRKKWEIGFVNPFKGVVEGINIGYVEFEERESLYTMIPLDIDEELSRNENAAISLMCESGGIADWEGDDEFHLLRSKKFPKLSFEELFSLFSTKRRAFLYNESIWNNTIKNELSWDVILDIITHMRSRD